MGHHSSDIIETLLNASDGGRGVGEKVACDVACSLLHGVLACQPEPRHTQYLSQHTCGMWVGRISQSTEH